MSLTTVTLLDRVADHLARAAELAETTNPALAGQIRLAGATLPGVADNSDLVPVSKCDDPPAPSSSTAGVADLLGQALACLDLVGPLDGPADLQLCAWHLHELHRIAAKDIAP